MLKRFLIGFARKLIQRGERQVGVPLDYVHKIGETDIGLLNRINKIMSFLNPNRKKHVPVAAYHAARIRGALAADCGACVEIEINLAKKAGLSAELVDALLSKEPVFEDNETMGAVVALSDAVVFHRQDDPNARARLEEVYGDAGVIELAYAMNGAAILPGIKRAMGFATACNLDLARKHASQT